MLLQRNPHLTPGFAADLAENIKRTHSGQAFWAGTGPPDTSCGDCAFWGYYKVTHNSVGVALPKARNTLAAQSFAS